MQKAYDAAHFEQNFGIVQLLLYAYDIFLYKKKIKCQNNVEKRCSDTFEINLEILLVVVSEAVLL